MCPVKVNDNFNEIEVIVILAVDPVKFTSIQNGADITLMKFTLLSFIFLERRRFYLFYGNSCLGLKANETPWKCRIFSVFK